MKIRFLNKTKKKLSSDLGFSLVESMICMLVVGLVSVTMVTGIQCSVHAYQKVIDEANGRVLLSTAMTMLRNELSTAEVTPTAAGTIRYKNADGELCTLEVVDGTEETITVTEYRTVSAGGTVQQIEVPVEKTVQKGGKAMLLRGGTNAPLVEPTTATGGMQVTYGDVSLSGKLLTFTDLHVYLPEADGKTEKKVVAAVETFCVRTQ